MRIVMKRFLLALALALSVSASVAEAGPRRRYQPTYQPTYQQPTYQPVYQTPTYAPPVVTPAGGYVIDSTTPVVTPADGSVTSYYTPAVTSASGAVTSSTTVVTAGYTTTGYDPAGWSPGDGLDEVNAKRAARGLRPFLRDEGLVQAARAAAAFRAQHRLFGHTSNDFAFVPAGTSASSAGCAAYEAGFGWMSCCTYDNYTYAGAAWVTGADGKRYMHLFVR
jgi:hypothetical protein